MRLVVASFAILAAALACTPRQAAESLVLNDVVVRSADIPFGGDARQKLDVYRQRTTLSPAPVIVFIYGGRWKYGAKRDYLLAGNDLARSGYIVVIPGYRLFPEQVFPAWVEDGASAIRWTHDNISRFGGDTTRIFVVGHSAGAHTATMLALDRHYLRDAGLGDNAVRGFVSLAGPVDTTWTDDDVQQIMGPREQWPSTYPYNFVDGRNPPLLLLHGTSDSVVSFGNSVRLAELIRSRGGCVRLGLFPGVGHVKIAAAFAFPTLRIAPVLRSVSAFIDDPVRDSCPVSGS